jgi:hypothetical protein
VAINSPNYNKAMSEITIEVSPEVAAAYLSASIEERKKIQSIVSILLQKQVDRDVALFRELMDEISDRAESRGLTPEILESILNEH